MLFNSIEFALFLPVVFGLYWFVLDGRRTGQNILILAASYVFYGWWDWRFLGLIVVSSITDYLVGIGLSRSSSQERRRLLLIVSIVVNLSMLGFFKYFNFFVDAARDALLTTGIQTDLSTLDIILPVGISFYTFQTLSYTIDVYRGKIAATDDWIAFFAYVGFFPQLVAGPIERASNLLPQFIRQRQFGANLAESGLRLMLWGLFKKVVVADNCGQHVDAIFANYADLSASTLVIGVVYFAIQIYGDFSGYSDIAIGTGRLFGFRLMRNFDYPYFSRDIAEFWRRWHISLSTWFRDYLYVPMGGSRGSTQESIRNIFVVFLVSGFWHGANWTFVIWGLLNALFFLPLFLRGSNRKHLEVVAPNQLLPRTREALSIVSTFILTCFAWIFFRSPSVTDAFRYSSKLFDASLFQMPSHKALVPMITIFVVWEWLSRQHEHGLDLLQDSNRVVRWCIYALLAYLVLLYGSSEQSFIYFQF